MRPEPAGLRLPAGKLGGVLMDVDRHQRIEQRAYAFWQAEGQPHGRHDEHWQRAARQIAAEEAVPIVEKRKKRQAPASQGRKKSKK